MSEVPFPTDPECLLTPRGSDWPDDAVGWIIFIDPKHRIRSSLPVSLAPSHERPELGPVWQIEFPELGVAVTRPSVHSVGDWHSPNPTRWRIVDRLPDESSDESLE
jgi:hypothetical protein